jgi:uncharacterized protein YjdB
MQPPATGPAAPTLTARPAASLDSAPSGVAAGYQPIADPLTVAASLIITRRPSRPLAPGATAALVAEVRDSQGGVVSPDAVRWFSTDTAVTAVDSMTGAIRAVGAGRAQVVAAAGTVRDSVRIVVRGGGAGSSAKARSEPVSLSLAMPDSLGVGETATLSLTALDAAGKPARGGQVTWSSSEPAVASVDPSGRIRAYSAGSTLIIARSGSESAIGSLKVLPAAVASVRVDGSRALKVGDTLGLGAQALDPRGVALSDRPIRWTSSNTEVAPIDSVSGIIVARAAGTAEITATSEGKAGTTRITILPQPRTGRAEQPPDQTAQRMAAPAADPAQVNQQVAQQALAGVEQCYTALKEKDVGRVQALYSPASKEDTDRLKKLSRILSTDEWNAQVGPRVEGAQKVAEESAQMEFSFHLTWKDAFGGRLSSYPVFRAEFSRLGSQLTMSSCRIVNSPKL